MKHFFTFIFTLFSLSLLAQTNSTKYTRAWGTYFDAETEEGGTFDISDMDTDAYGNIWLVGNVKGVTTTDFITSDAYQGETDTDEITGFIVKFSSEGILLYGTFFHGEEGAKISALSIEGNAVYIAGSTSSTTGIATPGAYQETLNVNTDPNGNSIISGPFIAKFNDMGVLQWATYYQGNRDDQINFIEAGYNNDFYIWGSTTSSNLATPGAFRESIPDPIPDGEGGLMVPRYPFLARFNDLGQRLWATYYAPDLPGPNGAGVLRVTNLLAGMAVDSFGNVYVAGTSQNTQGYYGTAGAHQSMDAGNVDQFVSKFSTEGVRSWSTYFGGSGTEANGKIAIPRNSLIISGLTSSSSNIATPGTWQDTYEANSVNSFVTRFNFEGQQEWGTYLRGYSSTILSVGVNINQEPFVYGGNNPDNYITYEGNYNEQEVGGADNRILKLNASGSSLEWGSYYGGIQREFIPPLWYTTISVTDNNEFYIIGTTQSTEHIASENAFQDSFIDGIGTFIAKFTPCPEPVMPIAESSQSFEPGETLNDLEVETQDWSGSEPILTWYADAAGTQILPPDTELEAEATYYVSQKIKGCNESELIPISTEALSIPKNKLLNAVLFPNPNEGVFYLSGLLTSRIKISIYSINGTMVYRKTMDVTNQTLKISPDQKLPAGVYFVQILTNNNTRFFKLIVE